MKRFDRRLSTAPAFPRVIALPPIPGFRHPVTRLDVKLRLERMPPPYLAGLRAIFILAGTRNQARSWRSSLGCYGLYSRRCVFLYAQDRDLGWADLESIRRFFLNDVLVHEVAHHVDRLRDAPYDTKEGFAHAFVQQRLA